MIPASPVLIRPDSSPWETVFAKDQPEYLQLPAVVTPGGMVTTRWRLCLVERIRLLFTGSLYLQVLTFGKPLQPVKLLVVEPSTEDCFCN
jgi:hypothetical protein